MEKYFGTNIKLLRSKHNRTQEDIALQVSKGRTAVANWEKELAEPSISDIIALANYFDISIDDLLITDLSKGNLNNNDITAEKPQKGNPKGNPSGNLNEPIQDYSLPKLQGGKLPQEIAQLQQLQHQQTDIQSKINALTTGLLAHLAHAIQDSSN